jgi:hypothetical protein
VGELSVCIEAEDANCACTAASCGTEAGAGYFAFGICAVIGIVGDVCGPIGSCSFSAA